MLQGTLKYLKEVKTVLKSDEKIKILELRKKGYGYKSIAGVLKIKRDAVRDYCKRQGLDGYLGYGKSVGVIANIKEINYSIKCKQCDKELNNDDRIGRKSKFCSDKCRRTWWNNHPEKKVKREKAWYSFICFYCGKNFKAYGNKNRKYCSGSCFQNHRWGEFKEKTGYEERMEEEAKNKF